MARFIIHTLYKINNPTGCDKESSVKILTHCNTGSLATGGYGTALGVIRALQDLGRLHTAFCTETRFCEIESVEKVDFKSDNSSKDSENLTVFAMHQPQQSQKLV